MTSPGYVNRRFMYTGQLAYGIKKDHTPKNTAWEGKYKASPLPAAFTGR
jgi:hypothetical protein